MSTKPEVPMAQVFGKANTPQAVFERSRATSEAAFSSGQQAPPQHKPVHSGVACPDCKDDTPVFAIPGRGLCCRNNHKFEDTDALLSRKPKKIPVPVSVTQQVGYEEVRLQIPSDVRQQLQARFGEKLAQHVAGVLFSLAKPGTFMVSGDDAKRLVEVFGEDIRDGNKLVGLAWALNQDRNSLRENAARVQEAQPTVQVTDGESVAMVFENRDTLAKCMDRARFNNMSLSKWIEQTLFSAFDSGWA